MKTSTILVFAFFIGFISSGYSQIVNLTTADGRPILQEKNNNIEGSPYFSETYLNSKIILQNESLVREASGRVNLLNQTFEFMNEGKLLEVTFAEIKNLELVNSAQGNVFRFVNGNQVGLSKKMLYQEVFQGDSFDVVKELSYKLSDVQVDGYSQSEAKRKVMESEELFLILSGKASSFKRNQKSFNSVLPLDFQQKLEQYAKSKKLSWKTDQNLIEILEYLDNN